MNTTSSAWTVVVTDPARQEVGRYPLKPGFALRIGRAPDSHVMIGVMSVSRNHGRIELGGNGLPVYHDEPGARGMLLDGDPVEGGSAALGERTELSLAGYRFTLSRVRAAPPTAPMGVPGTAAPGGAAPEASGIDTLLDRHIAGVRSYRSESRSVDAVRAERFEQDWKQVVEQARGIQARYGRHPLMLGFSVTKDEREILVKLKDSTPRGYSFFCLSRQHPEGLYPDMRAVWLREVGRPDDHFEDPMRGLDDLLARLASRMA